MSAVVELPHMMQSSFPLCSCGASAAFVAPTPVSTPQSHSAATSRAFRRRPVLSVARTQQSVRAPPRNALFSGQRDANKVSIERPLPNRRVVSSGIVIHAPLDVVWSVLSDYSRLADYIPNLALSRLRPHPHGGIRLEQCGVQKILGFKFKAAVTMDMKEVGPTSDTSRAIDFNLVESRDFQVFEGTWLMEAAPDGSEKTSLQYRVTIVPRGLVPVKAIEWRIGEDIPGNMNAVKRECETRRRQQAASRRRAAIRAQQQ